MFRKIWTWSQAATKKHKIVGYRRLNKCISSTQAISNEFKATNPNWLTWGKSRYLVQGDPHHLLIQDSPRSSSIHSWYFRKNKVWLLKPSDSWYGYIMRYCPYEILWTTSLAKRRDCMMRKLQPPEQSPPSPHNPPSAELLWLPVIIRLRVCAWQLLRICVCGLPSLSPFFLLHARLSKEYGWFSLLLCELISCNMIQGSPAVLAQQQTGQNNKSTSSSQVENMLNIHYNKCMKHFLHIVTI